MNATVDVIKALGDETRVRLLLLLREEEACVCELMEVFGMSQSRISHHLIILRDAGFLQDERRGKWNYYRINERALNGLTTSLVGLIAEQLGRDTVIEEDKKAFKRGKIILHSSC